MMFMAAQAWAAEIRYRNTDPAVSYVGSNSCSGCHNQIWRDYRQAAMGNSMYRADRPDELSALPEPVTIYDKNLDRYFEIYREGASLFQSEYQRGPDGKAVFRATHKIEYVMGVGVNGKTYLIRRGNHLFEAPLSYYSETKQWALSPGYVGVDLGFSRPATTACLFCHNGQPLAVKEREGEYRQPPFRFGETAIGCESCHGPGQLHLADTETGKPAQPVNSIINPAKLAPRLSDDVCMNCHQGGDTRILQPDKDYVDFRPGTPLSSISAIFRLPISEERRDDANLAERLPPMRGSPEMPALWKNSTMEMSKCYQASSGALHCLSCHSVHHGPAKKDTAPFYRAKCLSCHTESSCAKPLAARLHERPGDDCAGCHMPRRSMAGIDHSSMTSHRIVRFAGQPLPEIAFEKERGLKNLIWVNAPSATGGSGNPPSLSPLTKLAAYGETMQKNPALEKEYLAVLDELSRSNPDHPLVLAALGRKALFGRDYAKAEEYLSRALERGSQASTTFLDLADALAQTGRAEKAVEVLKRGIEVAPYTAVLQKSLVLDYITLKRYPEAHAAMKHYVELFPEDSFMRGLLAKADASMQPPNSVNR
jgi:hypothetical protein